MLQKSDCKKAIATLGLSGKEICLHSSLRSFDEKLENGPETLAEAFLECGCTLLVPTFSYDYIEPLPPQYRVAQNGGNGLDENQDRRSTDIFTPDSKCITKQNMGAFSAYILSRPDSVRGNHPINSFTAVGPAAHRLTKRQSSRDVYAPFAQLCRDGGFLLLVGLGLTRATIIHYAEQLAGRQLFVFAAKDQTGRIKPILGGGCSEGFGNLDGAVQSLENRVSAGGSLWRCFPAKAFMQACVQAIQTNPTITHCPDPACIRCRDAINGGPVFDFTL